MSTFKCVYLKYYIIFILIPTPEEISEEFWTLNQSSIIQTDKLTALRDF